MIDLITRKRVFVQIDKDKIPYIKVNKRYEEEHMAKILTLKHGVLYEWQWPDDEWSKGGGAIYVFGRLADPVKLQIVLDEISLY